MNRLTDSHRFLWRKIILTMKFMFIFFILGIFNSFASSLAQNDRLTVKADQMTFAEMASAIEAQSNYVLFYKSSDVKQTTLLNVDIENRNINDLLNTLLKETSLTYRISGKYIFIDKKPAGKVNADAVPEKNLIQQGKQITGSIVDEQGVPVIGANVIEVGTTNGTVTDIDGKFWLQVADDAIIRISYIGYIEQEIPIAGRNVLEIVLQEDTQSLDELVVVG
ncbi:MAG: carboxypeptidase-like regulatory domain-containing protein, partial [Proteiniphilum sp.]|nr:carboxypeptidase-like regulatory domain-containing protein [Proteiniphilum sp.]MDD3556041.1 carboxypeptidase-like regulatory domain-containing protein [Proteiniphilum sp.]MDD3979479.1 carboxypeptidase-like regulatory domain-containing protein [Proteiniphilum sp.]MDD5346368.1 carboxypeptidase-like regulatory domain-containing protein [Proteiniphilum sp.]